MPALLLYLLKANVALALFYLTYHFVLRRLTFYNLNRTFLLFGLLFSFLYPFIDVADFFERHQQLAVVNNYAVALPAAWEVSHAVAPQQQTFDYWLILVCLFWIGAVVVAARLLFQFVSLYKVHTQSVPAKYKTIGYRRVQSISHAFSFWQAIYLNPEQHKQHELDAILNHELVHVKGWHTLDVLLVELCTLLSWFNPGGWLMKTAIKENLEFIADQNVLNAGVDRKDYQYLLLKVTGASEPKIANQFNFSPLKTRIAMMNKMPTKRADQLRLLIVLPLVAVLLVAFKSTEQPQADNKTQNPVIERKITEHEADDYSAFYARNPEVSKVAWKSGGKIVVVLKSGKEETYLFGDKQSMAAAEEKYGKLPSAPPITKRDKETQTSKQDESFIITLEEMDYYKDKTKWPADYVNFLKRHPNVEKVGWKFDNKINYNLESIIIYLKSGKTEAYDYNRNPRIPAAEAKWGELPFLPPPPPPVRVKEEKLLPQEQKHEPRSEFFKENLNGQIGYTPYWNEKLKQNAPEDYKQFLKQNSNVANVSWLLVESQKNTTQGPTYKVESLVISLKNGVMEAYDYANPKSIAAATTKYGELPSIPSIPLALQVN